MGREASRCGSQTVGPEGRCPAQDPAASPRSPPGARDASRAARPSLPAQRRPVRHGAVGTLASITWRSAARRVFGPAGSRSSPRRGGGCARALARASGPRHSDRQGSEPRTRPPRPGVERPIPCTRTPHAAGSPERIGLRAAELAKARAGRARSGLALVGGLVRGLARFGSAVGGKTACGSGADLARRGRVAAPRADPSR